MSLLNQLETLEKAIGYAEVHLDRATESPTERQVELSDWLDDAYVKRERLMDMLRPPTAEELKLEEPEKPSVFSRMFESFVDWFRTSRSPKLSPYARRIASYMKRHPTATLKEARGHA